MLMSPLAPRAPAAVPSPAVVLVEPTAVPARSSELTVHVSGAVRQPGVYTLREGQRVRDALAAAGGATEAGDPNALNLAAPLKDGQRVAVPSVGPTPRPVGSVAAESGRPLNLNTASAAELETLPGVGPVTAARIVRYREESGGFRSVDELRTLKLVNQATFAKLQDLVVVE
jgi:competence protein ComEA